MICLSKEALVGESEENLVNKTVKVKHDWTFFFFIALTSLLIAAAIAWVSVKSGAEDSLESAVLNQSTQ